MRNGDGNGINMQTLRAHMDTKKENKTEDVSKQDMQQPVLEQGTTKTCTRCNKVKTLQNFNADKKGKYGRGSKCKECRKITNKTRYENNADEIKKRCAEYNNKNREKIRIRKKEKYIKDGGKEQRKYYEDNKTKCKKLHMIWKNNNKLHIKEYTKEYRNEHKEQTKNTKRQWDINNQENHMIEQRERRQRVPERVWANHSINGHRKRGCAIEITINQLEEIAKTTRKCEYCGNDLIYRGNIKKERQFIPTMDRINGENVIRIDNIQILCIKCNMTKSNRTHKEFVEYCKMISNKFD